MRAGKPSIKASLIESLKFLDYKTLKDIARIINYDQELLVDGVIKQGFMYAIFVYIMKHAISNKQPIKAIIERINEVAETFRFRPRQEATGGTGVEQNDADLRIKNRIFELLTSLPNLYRLADTKIQNFTILVQNQLSTLQQYQQVTQQITMNQQLMTVLNSTLDYKTAFANLIPQNSSPIATKAAFDGIEFIETEKFQAIQKNPEILYSELAEQQRQQQNYLDEIRENDANLDNLSDEITELNNRIGLIEEELEQYDLDKYGINLNDIKPESSASNSSWAPRPKFEFRRKQKNEELDELGFEFVKSQPRFDRADTNNRYENKVQELFEPNLIEQELKQWQNIFQSTLGIQIVFHSTTQKYPQRDLDVGLEAVSEMLKTIKTYGKN